MQKETTKENEMGLGNKNKREKRRKHRNLNQ